MPSMMACRHSNVAQSLWGRLSTCRPIVNRPFRWAGALTRGRRRGGRRRDPFHAHPRDAIALHLEPGVTPPSIFHLFAGRRDRAEPRTDELAERRPRARHTALPSKVARTARDENQWSGQAAAANRRPPHKWESPFTPFGCI